MLNLNRKGLPTDDVSYGIVVDALIELREQSSREGPSNITMEMAETLGYAGVTDELTSFLHSELFDHMIGVVGGDVDAESVLKHLGIPWGGNCLCASCTRTDSYRYVIPDMIAENVFMNVSRIVHQKKGGRVGKSNGTPNVGRTESQNA